MQKRYLCLFACLLTSPLAAYHPGAANNPRVCYASVNKGKEGGQSLRLRYFQGQPPMMMDWEGEDKNDKGEPQTYTFKVMRRSMIEQILVIDASAVEAYVDGKKQEANAVARLIDAKDTPVLACSQMPDADIFNIVKKGTIFLVVPTPLDGHHYGGPLPGPSSATEPPPPGEKGA
jgi:hypothetical protein